MDEKFMLFSTQAQVLGELSDEDAGKLFKALSAAAFGWEEVELEGTLRLLYMAMRPGIEKSATISKTRAEARIGKGKKQAEKQTKKQAEKQTEKEPYLDMEGEKEKEVDKDEGQDTLSGKPDGAPPFAEIVGYLNERTGKQFRASSGKAKRAITARWREGYTLADFRRVIDNRVATWASRPDMAEYLRPETLFGAKFDGYLNASDPPEPSRVRGNYGVDMTREGWGHVIGDDDTEAAA